MLNFPITDTHVHLWDISKLSYPWLKGVPALDRSFLLSDYDKAIGPQKVEKIVFVQCDCDPVQYASETAWITSLSAEDPRIVGIVSWAPLEKGEAVRPELERLIRENPLVRGIRRILQDEDLDFCLRPDFIHGVRMLADYGLTFDICIYARHLPNVVEFARQVPTVKMILDHIGKPDIKGKVFEPWAKGISQLSALENVYCKLSGLATEADHNAWTVDDLRPYAGHVLSSFGVERCIFGGDWPVCNLAADFTKSVETLESLLSGYSETEKQKIFRTNALDFYGI